MVSVAVRIVFGIVLWLSMKGEVKAPETADQNQPQQVEIKK